MLLSLFIRSVQANIRRSYRRLRLLVSFDFFIIILYLCGLSKNLEWTWHFYFSFDILEVGACWQLHKRDILLVFCWAFIYRCNFLFFLFLYKFRTLFCFLFFCFLSLKKSKSIWICIFCTHWHFLNNFIFLNFALTMSLKQRNLRRRVNNLRLFRRF